MEPNSRRGSPPEIGTIRRIATGFASGIHHLSISEKIYSIVALLFVITTFLVVMSVQSARLQTAYQQLLASSASATMNIERVNGLIYALIMESRPERVKAAESSEEFLKRSRELADVVAEWEQTVRSDDAPQFSAFRQRITQFIDFRKELVRRAVEIGPAAGRAWGDNDANRALRSQLNTDLAAFARLYGERSHDLADLGDQSRYALWYLFALGLGAWAFTALNILVMHQYVLGPLSDITEVTDLIAAGKVDCRIPYIDRRDEIGSLAHAVQNFRDAVSRNFELERLELGTAKQRDAVMVERDKLTDKYHMTKWQLSAAINSMPQGMIMLDGKGDVLAINGQYRKMYGLPVAVKTGSSLREIVQHRFDNGLFAGNVTKYVAAIVARIAKRQPSSSEMTLTDGRVISIQEGAMDGGGWVATHEDVTERRRGQRMRERTEQFLATVIENIPEGIVAKDVRNLRYVFVNRAAGKMIGMSRAEIMGKTARELFPAQAADLIERRDRQLLEQKQQLEAIVDTIDNPIKGRRTIAVRRLQIGGADRESQLLVSMIEDRTDQAAGADAAA